MGEIIMTVYILCMKHKRAFNFIEVIEVFVDDEKSAYEAKDKFNETKPSYALSIIKTYEVKNERNCSDGRRENIRKIRHRTRSLLYS